MAATITSDDPEITYASFAIEKMETDENGDLIVHGKASDGGIDSDNQIVDPAWMAKAAPTWLETGGNVRVQHNPTRDPAGVGIKVETDGDGATWVTTKVIESQAKRLVAGGALRAYSVGIARPTIVRDGTAAGGRITGGELVEISLVDRPANKRCGIQLVKSEEGWVGEVFGTDEDINKALTIEKAVQQVADGIRPIDEVRKEYSSNGDISSGDITLTFTPNDLMKIVQNKFVEKHYDQLAFQAVADAEEEALKAAYNDEDIMKHIQPLEKDHRDFSADRRKDLAGQGNALPDGSYPIPDADALRRAAILARSGHGNVSGARALIARRAKELGVANPLSSSDSQKELSVEDVLVKGTETEVVKEADADLTKDPATPKPKKGKKAKKMPPWLAGSGEDGDAAEKGSMPAKCDDDADDDGDEEDDAVKCDSPSGTPKSTSGAKDAADMKEIPNTSAAPESPMPAGRSTPDTKSYASNPEVAAMLRFKTIGIDADMGRLHDLTCPAYSPETVTEYHPYASFKSIIDTGVWQRKAVDAAAGPLQKAMAIAQVWAAAEILKGADEGELNEYRQAAHKAFRDANPGPTSYPSPGCVEPSGYKRPLITDGHSSTSPGHSGANTSPMVATGPVDGTSGFDKPPLTSGHQSPSPSFMKNDWEYPKTPGQPQSIPYAYLEKEKARRALSMMHDHLATAFPLACPMLAQDAYRHDFTPAVTPTVGVGKSEDVETTPVQAETAKVEDISDEYIEKAKKKMRKKLGKKVLAGSMTVDEARAKLGRNVSQKAVELQKQELLDDLTAKVEAGTLTPEQARILWEYPVTKTVYVEAGDKNITPNQIRETQDALNKAAVGSQDKIIVLPPGSKSDVVSKGTDPDVIKSAVTEALTPLLAKMQELEDYKAKTEERFEKLADLADPSTNAFTGLAKKTVNKSAHPAGVPSQTEIAERTQNMVIRQLQRTARISDDPAEREAAWSALHKFQSTE